MYSLPPHEPRCAPPFWRRCLAFARDEAAGTNSQTAERERILIVEDDFLVVTQIEAALEEAGFEIAGIAASADEAIKLASSQRPLLCVMDIRLAGSRDGVDAALELFKVHGIRCIFATAHHDPDVRSRAQSADPLGWLQKPYTMVSLIAMVRRAMSDLRDRER